MSSSPEVLSLIQILRRAVQLRPDWRSQINLAIGRLENEQSVGDEPNSLLKALQNVVATIVGGEPSSFQHCGALAVKTKDWKASAVLVAPGLMLTAGHLINGLLVNIGATSVLEVRTLKTAVTDETLLSGPEVIGGEFIVHPTFKEFGKPDIGAFRLERDARAELAELATDDEMKKATKVVLAGFGLDDSNSAGTQRQVEVDIQYMKGGAMGPHHEIAKKLKGFEPDNEFVAGFGFKGACHGDSGGPAYIMMDGKPKLAGIISGGNDNCDGLTIITRIDTQRKWILDQIKESIN